MSVHPFYAVVAALLTSLSLIGLVLRTVLGLCLSALAAMMMRSPLAAVLVILLIPPMALPIVTSPFLPARDLIAIYPAAVLAWAMWLAWKTRFA